MKNLLVLTDFSRESDNALAYATDLAAKMKYKIVLLHVFEPDLINILYNAMVNANESFHSSVSEELLKSAERIIQHKVPFKTAVEDGSVTRVLNQFSDRISSEFIIIGAKALESLAQGKRKHTYVILKNARRPVIVVPAGSSLKNVSHIVYATMYHRSDIEEIAMLADFAKTFSARLTILHVARASDSKEEELLTSFKCNVNSQVDYKNISYQLIIGDPVQKIEELLNNNFADLIALSTGQRVLVMNQLDPRRSRQVVSRSRTPVMIFHHSTQPLIL
jgi:nucleotide-binding universal stress UspA family protein